MYEEWYAMRAAQVAAFEAAEAERAALEQAPPPEPTPREPTFLEAVERVGARLQIERALMNIASASITTEDDGEIVLHIVGEITPAVADRLIAKLHRRPSASSISVLIDSEGGFAAQAERINEALVTHPGRVATVVERVCNSAAIAVFMAGDERFAKPAATFTFHKTTGAPKSECAAHDVFEQVRISQRASVTLEQVAAWQAAGTVLDAEEAHAAGLVHHVWDEEAAAALEQIPDDFEIRTITGAHARLAMPAAAVASLAGAIRARRPIGCVGLPRAMIAAAVDTAGIAQREA